MSLVGGFLPPAIIEIQVIAGEAIAKLKEVNAQMAILEKQATMTGASITNMEKATAFTGKAMKVMGIAAVAVGALSVHAAMNAETAFARMGKAMSDAGVGSQVNVQHAKDLADGNIKLGFTTEQTANAYGTLITATHSTAEANYLLTDAMDLARYKNIDLSTAGTIMARATQGSAKAFKELGITLDTSLPKQQAINKALDEFRQRIGGQAQAFMGTFQGKVQGMAAQFEKLQEQIGNKLIPILESVMTFLSKYGGILVWLTGIIGGSIIAFKLFTVGMTAWNTVSAIFGARLASQIALQEAHAIALAAEVAAQDALTIAVAASTDSYLLADIAYLSTTEAEAALVIATDALVIAEGELTVASRFASGAMAMLSTAMDANPIGVFIVAVTALIVVLKELFSWLNKETDPNKVLVKNQVRGTGGRGSTGLQTGYVDANLFPSTKNRDIALPINEGQTLANLMSYTGKKAVPTVVKSLMDLMKEEWKKQASVDVGSLFAPLLGIDANGNLSVTSKGMIRTSVSTWGKTIGTGIEGMITALKDKLKAAKQFNADLKKLLKEGFSIDFATEILAQGVTTGDQIAKTLLNGTLAQKKSIQTIYGAIKTEAATGLNKSPTPPVTNNHVTIKTKTDAKPHHIAKEVVHGIKYGLAQKGAKGDS